MWPWDWVIAAGNAISGLSQKAIDWVNSLIASVTSWVSSAIDSIWSSITGIWHDIQSVWDQLVGFVNNLWVQLWAGITSLGHTISDWVSRLVNDLWSFINRLYDWASNELGRLGGLIDKVWNDITRWVQTEIWDPLVRAYEDVKTWVTGLFNRVWQYIEHPELLVSLIGGFLLRLWMQYVMRYAMPLARWVVRNMMGLAGPVFDLLESILTNIL